MDEENHEEVKSFKDLSLYEPLIEACNTLGCTVPTKLQAEAIPHALQGKDIIGLTQTGSGKTGAFALPIIQALLDAASPEPIFACVLSPTRELAIQIAEQFEALGANIGLRTALIVGGVNMTQQALLNGKRPHIIVGTPGRLMDHLIYTKGFSLSTLKYLVLDEADRLLNQDFENAVDDILELIPLERRTYLFSATMTRKVEKLQKACLRNPVKDCYLIFILKEMSGSTMVFTRTCYTTKVLAIMLCNLGLRAVPIKGRMTQAKRLGALNKFKAGDRNILICTDMASRGLDIPSVDMVINYEIPSNSKDYIHRVGRTARAGSSGVGISFVNELELKYFVHIENLIVEVLVDWERVTEARRIANMKVRQRRTTQRNFRSN